ncbi:MAG TPA: hypothetical protein VMT52_17575 [Planctomycetota bacterium]|nr:hypothetical protein [Planctomycetota bacterium]
MTTQSPHPRKIDLDQITIRSWPKVIFLYPILITSFFCGIGQTITGEGETLVIEEAPPPPVTEGAPAAEGAPTAEGAPATEGEPVVKMVDRSNFPATAGRIFFIVLCLNILVISFEFSRFKTLAIFFFVLAVLFFLLYLSTTWEVFAFLKEIYNRFDPRASTSFYYALGIYLVLVFFAVFLTTRFNYWIIRSNEILHKEGLLGDVKRFPSPNLKMTKEITDVFEFLLLGSGRIVLYPASEKQAIVLDHVLRVNAAEVAIQDLLSSLSVEIENPPHHSHSAEEESIGG